MSDHHDIHHDPVAGPWSGGWFLALVAALAAVAMTEFVAVIEAPALAMIGAVTFLVFAVLLGSGGVELTLSEDPAGGGDGHGHGHGHGSHH